MTHAIALFAKTPELTPVKTRLAADLGQPHADKIYTLCVDCLQEVLSEFQKEHNEFEIFWAIAEEEGSKNNFWHNRLFQKTWTGEGELGTRLYNVHNQLLQKYDSVILIGTDSPQLSVDDLNKAAQELKTNKNVIGPAHDGGYYLFGSDFLIPKNIWESVPYSEDNTRDEFLKLLEYDVPLLEPKSDLDTVQDIQKIINEMPEDKMPSQVKLLKLLSNLGF